jgi:glycosyltransferase involved in cell wall biosynthesis
MFEWFIEPLRKSIADNNITTPIQIVVVDGFLYESSDKSARKEYFASRVGEIELTHVSPKPTRWQGEFRLTQDNYFAASNTRNTGACYAKYDYLVYVDDLGIISPTWLQAVINAMEKNEIHCGAYKKIKTIIYENLLYAGGDDTHGIDHRLNVYKNDISKCPGSHLYGSSFCLPKAVYFKINGQNEMCDGLSGEDYDFGIRLDKSGYSIYYNKLMLIHESEYAFGSDTDRKCLRKDPVITEDKYKELLKFYNLNDIYVGKRDLSHFMLSYVYSGPNKVNPEFSLEVYNNSILQGKTDPFLKPVYGEIHFFTKKLISDNNCLS